LTDLGSPWAAPLLEWEAAEGPGQWGGRCGSAAEASAPALEGRRRAGGWPGRVRALAGEGPRRPMVRAGGAERPSSGEDAGGGGGYGGLG
jgi:hypothetical protein